MNKALKILIIILSCLIALVLSAVIAFYGITADAKLQPQKLISYDKSISIYDDEGNEIESASLTSKRASVQLEQLSEDTVNAFIASEDRSFYSHNGLNYKRMLKALYKNLKSFSFKEGASTISQQLIKNTHLSGDKTIARKLKEIKLTKQLERRYSKDEILEMYLNTIYFGHNCYGLQSAANFYFDKNAKDLSLEESATIVGLLISPNNYSPFKNPEKCLARRNVVLKNMYDCGFICEERYENAAEQPIETSQSNVKARFSAYYAALFDELEELNLNPYGEITEYKIMTYLNPSVQKAVEEFDFGCDKSIFLRNSEGGVCAFTSTIGQAKRQIGSTAKPIFVYGPAINENKLHSFTKICDEPVNFNGYQPENFDKKYHGKVTVEQCVAQSLNVPAVKTLNTLGLGTAEQYAAKMGVILEESEKNLNFALGGMSHGLSLKELCDCYSIFPNDGFFTKSHYIKCIKDKNNNIIYSPNAEKTPVFKDGTCSVMNEILNITAKNGTAKKLNDLNYDIACKTGTCGTKEGNTDAYAVGYTSDCCVGVWLGDKDNKKMQVYGGNQCCEALKKIFNVLYKEKTPLPLDYESGTESVYLDREEYENNDKILIAEDLSPKLNKLKVRCVTDNIPKEKSNRFSCPTIKNPSISVNNNQICIELCQTKYYSYIINRQNEGKTETVYKGKWTNKIFDSPAPGTYTYTVTPFYDDGKTIYTGEKISLSKVIIAGENNKEKIPDIVFKDWFND